MKTKKAETISMNIIILAALALLVLVVVSLIFIARADVFTPKEMKDDVSEPLPEEFDPCDLFEQMWKDLQPVEQEIHIEVLYEGGNTYDQALKTGYCFDVYYDENPSWAFEEIYYPRTLSNRYKTLDFSFMRTKLDESITVVFNGENHTFILPCTKEHHYNIYINHTQEERYDCYFKGELRHSKIKYEELIKYTCDKYKVSCY